MPFQKWFKTMPNASEGQIVLISDEKLKRSQWKLGRIVKVHPGRDGLVRSVTLKTNKGELRRPVQKLHLLEN